MFRIPAICVLVVVTLCLPATANTLTDVGGNDWCPDTIDSDFLYTSGGQVDAPVVNEQQYCDGDSEDASMTVLPNPPVDVSCHDDPSGAGGAADTTCVGGARSSTDGVFNRGELGRDYPQATGVTFEITAGPGMQVNFRACTTVIASGGPGDCYDNYDSTPFGACLMASSGPVDLIAAVNADAGADIPATEFVDSAYVFWTRMPQDPLSLPDYTVCGNTNPAPRSVLFDWTYAPWPSTPGVSADATDGGSLLRIVGLHPAGCTLDYDGVASAPSGGMAGVWLLGYNGQVGFSNEVAGPGTASLSGPTFVPFGTWVVVAYANGIGEQGALESSAFVTCAAGST